MEKVVQVFSCFMLAFVVIYSWLKIRFSYWDKRKIANIKPSLAFNELTWMLGSESRFSYYRKLYDRLAPHKYGGIFTFLAPKLLIRDPEMIKTVLVDKFENFSNRTQSSYLENDSLTHSLFNLQDGSWRRSRVCLVQIFNNANLRGMFRLIGNSALKLRNLDSGIVDVSDTTRLYITDIVMSCVFGLEEDSGWDSNSKFIRMSNNLRHKNSLRVKIFEILSMIPRDKRHYFSWLLRKDESADYFKQLLSNTIDSRKKLAEGRSDFVQFFIKLMEFSGSKKDDKNGKDVFKWTLESTQAHCIHFMFASTVAIPTVISFALYEIAKSPAIQAKLRQEVEEHAELANGLLEYETANQLRYLHNIVQETLRKYPAFAVVQRICSKSCTLLESELCVERGTRVTIPVAGIHHDPKFYPNPEIFDPERFNENEKKFRHRYCYLPFGSGPRDCIGKTFSLLCIKAAILSVISKFQVSVLPESEVNLQFLPRKCTTRVASIKLKFAEVQ